MCRGLIGKKLGMSGIFSPAGNYVPVTVIQAGPCVVTQIKTKASDGYNALQLGFETQKDSRSNRPLKGHFTKSGGNCYAYLREMAVDDPSEFSVGQTIGAELFSVGEHVDVVGTTKGRGFSGTIKRHGFHRGPKTHGCKNIRPPGSIGCSAWPSKVAKGKKMPGQYGNTRKTISNLEIVDIRPEDNVIMVKGAVPGHATGLVSIKKLKFAK
jgi:large subunit ribosomal protein L3